MGPDPSSHRNPNCCHSTETVSWVRRNTCHGPGEEPEGHRGPVKEGVCHRVEQETPALSREFRRGLQRRQTASWIVGCKGESNRPRFQTPLHHWQLGSFITTTPPEPVSFICETG